MHEHLFCGWPLYDVIMLSRIFADLMCIKTLTSQSANTPLETEELHASTWYTAMAGKLSKQGYTNFTKIPQSSQNSRCQKDNIKHVSHRGPTNIRCHGTKVSCPGDLAPGIWAPLCPRISGQNPLTNVVASNMLYSSDTNVHCGNQGAKCFYPGAFTTKIVSLTYLLHGAESFLRS